MRSSTRTLTITRPVRNPAVDAAIAAARALDRLQREPVSGPLARSFS